MHELSVLAAADEAPTRECLIAHGRVLTYADVAARVRSALSVLRAQNVACGDRVALTPKVDLDSVVWLYALFEMGCPVVLLHPRLTDPERAVVLREAQPARLITERLPGAAAADQIPTPHPVAADQTLAIAYTSGSSGTPRGALLSRRAFIASEAAHAANLKWLPDDRWLLCMPLAHVGGLSVLTRCLIARRCVVLSSDTFDPAAVAEAMARHRATLLSVVPTMLHRLLTFEASSWAPDPALRAVLVGGAPFSDALRTLAVQRGVPALATYGCTEACSQVSTQSPEQRELPGSGAPLLGVEVRIEEDEIQVRGDMLMDNYVGENRSRPPWTADGWLRTGDFGSFLPDGQLLVRGRIDDLIVTGGENVAPQEVEAWLESVPGIVAACVFAQPHQEWGEEVVAAVATDSTRYSTSILHERLAKELAPYKRPKRIAVLEGLPLNRSGKVDRSAVMSLCAGRLRPV